MASNNSNLIVELIARDKMTQPIKGIQSSIIRFVGAVSATLAAVRVTAFPVQQALDFDRAMRDVQKTTNFTDNQIVKLSTDLNQLSTELAVSQQELAAIAAVGGQLGLGSEGVDAIRQFTESVARAQITLGLTAEATAEVGAQLLNIFSIDVSNIENVFSLINELTNNSVANAADLADIMKRVGNIAGLSVEQVGALSAFARDLGITAEVAGTSYAKFFTNLSTQAEDFAKIMQVSTEEWVSLVEQDAVNALFQASAAISELDSVAKSTAIKELFGGGRLFSFGSKIVDAASTDFARFNELLGLANKAYAEGTSSIKEYENILKSVKEQFNVVGNAVRGLAIEVGTTLLPDLERLATALREFLTSDVGRDLFLELGTLFKDAAVFVEELVTALVESNVEWGNVLRNIGLVIAAFGAFLAIGILIHILKTAAGWALLASKVKQAVISQIANIRASYAQAVATRAASQAAAAAAATTTAAAASTAAAGAAATVASNGFLKLGAAIRIIGGLLFGWVSILTLVATAIYTFWDDITNAFSSGSDKLSEKSKRERRAAMRALKDDAREAVAVFEAAVNRPDFRANKQTPFVDPASELETKGLNAYAAAVSNIAEQFATLEKAVRGADVYLIDLRDNVDKNYDATVRAKKELKAYQEELVVLEKVLSDWEETDIYGLQVGDAAKDVEVAKQNIKEVTEEIEKRTKAQKELLELEKKIGAQRGRLNEEVDLLGERLAKSGAITKEAVEVLKAQRDSLVIQKEFNETKKEQARLEKIIGDAEDRNAKRKSGDSDYEDLVEQRKALDDVNVKYTLLNGQLQLAKTNQAELAKELNAGQLGTIATIEQADLQTQERLLEIMKEYEDVIPYQRDLNEEFRKNIFNQSVIKAANEAALKSFLQYAKPIRDVLSTVDGMYDNIGKTVRKTIRDLQNLGLELDEILDKRKQERELSQGGAELEKKLAEKEKRINEEADRLVRREVANARSSGRAVDTGYIDKINKQRDADLEAAKASAEVGKAQLEADVVRKNSAESVKKLTGLMNEYKTTATRLQEISKNEKLLASPEGQKEVTGLVVRMKELEGEIASATGQAKNFSKELSDIDAFKPAFTGDTSIGVPVVSDQEVAKFNNTIKKATAGYADIQKAAIESANTVGKSINSILSKQESEYTTKIKQSNELIGTYIKALPTDVAKAVVAASSNVAKAFKGISDDWLVAKGQIENNPINLAADFEQNISDALGGQNLFDTLSAELGKEVAEAIQVAGNQLSYLAFSTTEKAFDDEVKKIKDKAKGQAIEFDGVLGFDPTQIQENLDKGSPFTIKAELDVDSKFDSISAALGLNNVPGRASGGPIWGPGTSTSDSILARLSRGEYVVKAAAVKKYGMGFLDFINRMAMPKQQLPAFASGGYIGDAVSSVIRSGNDTGTTDRVTVDLNIGGETHSLFGEREQVRNLMSTMKRLSKGA